jgi:urea transporter
MAAACPGSGGAVALLAAWSPVSVVLCVIAVLVSVGLLCVVDCPVQQRVVSSLTKGAAGGRGVVHAAHRPG